MKCIKYVFCPREDNNRGKWISNQREDRFEAVTDDEAEDRMSEIMFDANTVPNETELLRPGVVRLALGDHGEPHFWVEWRDKNEGDLEEIDPINAMRLITEGQILLQVACCNPADNKPHHWEGEARLHRV